MTDIETWASLSAAGDLYGPAMRVESKEEADAYLNKLVQMQVAEGVHPDIATKIIKANLGYYTGYLSHQERERVERLYDCAHPVFGSIKELGAPTTQEAFTLGFNRGVEGCPQTLAELRESQNGPAISDIAP